MRYHSKPQLLQDVESEFHTLRALLLSIPRTSYREPDVWGEGWTIHDLVAHLAEWHCLFLGWYNDGLRGLIPEMPAAGFRWSETPKLNRHIWLKHRDRSTDAVWKELETSHARILELVRELSQEELLGRGHFPWTRSNGLVTYLGANTASHYRFAMKVLRRWLKQQSARGG